MYRTFTNGREKSFKGIQERSDGKSKIIIVRKCRDSSRIREYLGVVSY